jgi:hypothetical protein
MFWGGLGPISVPLSNILEKLLANRPQFRRSGRLRGNIQPNSGASVAETCMVVDLHVGLGDPSMAPGRRQLPPSPLIVSELLMWPNSAG